MPLTIAQLAALAESRKDPLDLPGTLTPREVAAYVDETTVLNQRLAAARTAEQTLAEVAPALAADTAWLTHLTAWRETLCDELLAIKSPIRDHAIKERADKLMWSIRVIDFGLGVSTLGPIVTLAPTRIGELMADAGYDPSPRAWRGAQKEVEHRIADLTRRQAEAQAQLAEALLSDAERATRDAERATLSATLNTMTIRNDKDGTGLAAFTPDGDPLPVADMTPAQRAAFEAFSHASVSR